MNIQINDIHSVITALVSLVFIIIIIIIYLKEPDHETRSFGELDYTSCDVCFLIHLKELTHMSHLVGNLIMLVELHVFFDSLRRMDSCHLFWNHYTMYTLSFFNSLKRTSS